MSSRFVFLLVLGVIYASHFDAYPLSTQNRWIIDEATGKRAKLVCANWAGHLQPMIPEGLDQRPLKDIVGELVKHSFNCVCLTYAIYMWTRYGNKNVSATFASLDVLEVVKGIAKNNPYVLSMTHVQTFDVVVHELGNQNVHFNPQEWVHGLTLAAKHFSGNHVVVEMSLRNELHGPRQNLKDWYRYMSQGAVVIHKTNPNVLVLISGLNYDTELQFLRRKPLNIDLGKKMVFETHLYSWSRIGTLKLREIWTKQPLNRICANNVKAIDYRAGFLITGKNATSLIFTEFGFNEAGSSVEDNKFLTCLQTYLFGKDLEWGLRAFQEPNSNASIVNILYQPLSGQCAQVNDKNEVELGSCETKNRWVRGEDTTKIVLHGSKKCLTTVGEGLPVVVFDCERNKNSWKFVSLSKLHLATLNQHEEQVCL
ncbi:endoglucanase [Vigna unguiculata]|uniref:Endoglucanase n=1 Tax=Vigna unguiculata TaxID=3917 RepID=A0A4D6MQQ8_VIGUN|nr:endoglucanase [Vigna unguiculata]